MRILVVLLLAVVATYGESLYLAKGSKVKDFKFSADRKIYYDDHMAIFAGEDRESDEALLFTINDEYDNFIYRFEEGKKDLPEDIKSIVKKSKLFDGFAIISVDKRDVKDLYPAVHGGIVKLFNREVKESKKSNFNYKAPKQKSSLVEDLLNLVDGDRLEGDIQTMEDFGTRNCYKPQSVEAQNWIKEQFEAIGLDVTIQDFPMGGGESSDNVIAVQTGTKYPDEYIICGGHYDSIVNNGNNDDAPGADDNASGTAAVIEIARAMSTHQFERSIVYCAWSGEEYGLYGSEAYASDASSNGMNILGYYNLDMIGYRHPGDEIHTDIMAPSSAEPLVQFYKDNCATYIPELGVFDGQMVGGDSDHTSFNQNGYMGIFPFEDSQNYSPYIHTAQDIVGTSFNSQEMAVLITKGSLASMIIMASDRVSDLVAIPEDSKVTLQWSAFEDADEYKIYRDGTLLTTLEEINYIDLDVVNNTEYSYYITALLSDGSETIPSNSISVTPKVPMALPFFDGFENQFSVYWEFEGADWVIDPTPQSGSYSAKSGDIGHSSETQMILEAVVTGENGTLSFDYKVSSESGYDFFKATLNGSEIGSWSGEVDWSNKSVSLSQGLNKLVFEYKKDSYMTSGSDCAWVDNVEITQESSIESSLPSELKLISQYPNPFNPTTTINFSIPTHGEIMFTVFNAAGEQIYNSTNSDGKSGINSINFDGSNLNSGIYFYKIESNGNTISGKMVLAK